MDFGDGLRTCSIRVLLGMGDGMEMLHLTWDEVDLGGAVFACPVRSKTKMGRVLPISPPLKEVLARRLARARR